MHVVRRKAPGLLCTKHINFVFPQQKDCAIFRYFYVVKALCQKRNQNLVHESLDLSDVLEFIRFASTILSEAVISRTGLLPVLPDMPSLTEVLY
jgi:hypothetical protein